MRHYDKHYFLVRHTCMLGASILLLFGLIGLIAVIQRTYGQGNDFVDFISCMLFVIGIGAFVLIVFMSVNLVNTALLPRDYTLYDHMLMNGVKYKLTWQSVDDVVDSYNVIYTNLIFIKGHITKTAQYIKHNSK